VLASSVSINTTGLPSNAGRGKVNSFVSGATDGVVFNYAQG